MRGIHRSPVTSPHKGQWRGAFIVSLICAWINRWVNNREAGNLRQYRAHYDAIVMLAHICVTRARLPNLHYAGTSKQSNCTFLQQRWPFLLHQPRFCFSNNERINFQIWSPPKLIIFKRGSIKIRYRFTCIYIYICVCVCVLTIIAKSYQLKKTSTQTITKISFRFHSLGTGAWMLYFRIDSTSNNADVFTMPISMCG